MENDVVNGECGTSADKGISYDNTPAGTQIAAPLTNPLGAKQGFARKSAPTDTSIASATDSKVSSGPMV